MLLSFILGSYCSYHTQAAIMMLIPIFFLCIFPFFPESSEFLTKQERKIEAQNSYSFFRDETPIEPEIKSSTAPEPKKLEETPLCFSDFSKY